MSDSTRPALHVWLLKAALAVAVIYAAGFLVFAASLPKVPAVKGTPDAIVALTGGGARLDAAVSLFETGIGKRLLITGVHPATTKADLKRLAHGGVRFDCCADLGFSAANTHGNAAETKAWAKAHHYHSLVIVTASYHMPRSMAEFRTEMPNIKLEPYPVEPGGVNLTAWWRDPHTFRLLQGEYAKYLASLVLTNFVPDKERNAIEPSTVKSGANSAL